MLWAGNRRMEAFTESFAVSRLCYGFLESGRVKKSLWRPWPKVNFKTGQSSRSYNNFSHGKWHTSRMRLGRPGSREENRKKQMFRRKNNRLASRKFRRDGWGFGTASIDRPSVEKAENIVGKLRRRSSRCRWPTCRPERSSSSGFGGY